MANLIQDLDAQISKHDFALIVFYRGTFCPFCTAYLKDLESLRAPIAAANGTTIAITAEAKVKLPTMQKNSGYTGQTIVDTHNVLAAELKRRGVVEVAISEKWGYPYGMAQPAVVVLRRDGGVGFRWAIVPGVMNLGGAKDRPILKEVWENTEAELKGEKAVHDKLSKTSFVGLVCGKIFGLWRGS